MTSPVELRARQQAANQINNHLFEMNTKYSVVLDGGKVSVLIFDRHVKKIGRYEHVRHIPTFLSFTDFRNLHLNKTVIDGRKHVALGSWWLQHPGRQQYAGIIFEPGGADVVDDRLNLWKGFGVKPAQGDWSLMQAHIKDVMASGVESDCVYIISWLAWCVQHPAERAEVALVFRGKRGTGKGTLGNTMCRIFGQHGVHISSADHLTGRFNAHLRDACFMFADEAYWPGDKKSEGSLKRMITEPDLFIEGKGRDGVTTNNMLHVIVAGNDDWLVPAGESERRFATFEVSDCHIQDEAWFDPLYAQMENGGYAGMLYDLLELDLAGWHPRRIPKTAELIKQQQQTLSALNSWWVELLEIGTLEGANPVQPNCAVSNDYLREVKETQSQYSTSKTTRTRTTNREEHQTIGECSVTKNVKQRGLFDQARAIEPRLRHHASDTALGSYLAKQGCVRSRVLRRRGWRFPSLSDCRKAWEVRFPGWPWHDPDLTDWRADVDADGGSTDAADDEPQGQADREVDDDIPF